MIDWLIDDNDDGDDNDDVAINEISNNMKLPIYAVLVGRVSFLHSNCRFSSFFDRWCFVLCCLPFFSSFLGVKSMRTVQIKKRERERERERENIH